jgi:hypothetical protein
MKSIFNPRTGVLAAMILTAGALRLVSAGNNPFISNFTPIGAIALFGGCYFSEKWKAYLLPILTLWISDIVINSMFYSHKLELFYDGFAWNYASFALAVFIGTFIKKVNVTNVLVSGIVSAVLFWLISDFGVWIGGTMYPKTAGGLVECYTAALLFLRNMTMSNIVFGGIMFGAFEWAKNRFPALQANNA